MPLIHLSWPPDICGAVEATITKPNVSSNGDGGDSHKAHAFVTLFYFQRKDRSRGLWEAVGDGSLIMNGLVKHSLSLCH